MTTDLSAFLQRRFLPVLVSLVVISHLWAIWAFGATFWVDSSIYAGVADCLGSAAKLRAIYDSSGIMVYSHVGLGVPLLWAGLSLFPPWAQWPLMALLQHGLAAFATIFAFATANRLWPSAWHLAGAALLSCLPLFQSLHNALMTESIAASALLIAMVLLLRLITARKPNRYDWLALLFCVFTVIQFRSYVGLMIAIPAAGILAWRRDYFRWTSWLALFAVVAAGALAFPVYRYAMIGKFFLPSGGTNALVHAVWANPRPSESARKKIKKIGLPAGFPAKDLFKTSFNYDRACEFAAAWEKEGLTRREINTRIGKLRRVLLGDHAGIWWNCMRCGVASCGWTNLAFASSSADPVFVGLNAPQSLQHHRNHYRWVSWLTVDSYQVFGDQLFLRQWASISNAHEVQPRFWKIIAPYLNSGPATLRDPLHLGRLPLDIWPTLGLIGLGICLVRVPSVGLILGFPLLLNMAVCASLPVADPRYSYALIPLYVLACTIGLACRNGSRGLRLRLGEYLRCRAVQLQRRKNNPLNIVMGTALQSLARKLPVTEPPNLASLSYAQEGEDMVLRRIFEPAKPGFFVDVGAHHPMRFSNTFYFYQQGWRGINIDATPGSMERFRVARPGDVNLEVAISQTGEAMTLFNFQDPALNTCDEKLAAYYVGLGIPVVKKCRVESMTLAAALDKHLPAGTAVDFLSIDVEGLDLEVLSSNDWARFRPRYILAELLNCPLSEISGHPVYQFLAQRGYRLIAKTVNTAFFESGEQGS